MEVINNNNNGSGGSSVDIVPIVVGVVVGVVGLIILIVIVLCIINRMRIAREEASEKESIEHKDKYLVVTTNTEGPQKPTQRMGGDMFLPTLEQVPSMKDVMKSNEPLNEKL